MTSTLEKVAGETRRRLTLVERSVATIACVFIVFFAWVVVASWFGESVEIQLRDIIAMPKAVSLDYKYYDRSRTVVQKYGTLSDAATVRGYYLRQLSLEKWTYSSTKRIGSGVIDTYCRDGFAARVEINAFNDAGDYAAAQSQWGSQWPTIFEIEISKGEVVFPRPDWDCINFGGLPYRPSRRD
ncbi:MAG TPA: hypothetical protein VGL66_09370 [Caulobacteraceae bacterium]|jgi:hypothetical protein